MKRQGCIGLLLVNGVLLLLVIVWSIPTVGLLISSFRDRFDIQTSGWWTVFPHRAWETVTVLDPKELELDPDGVMAVEGVEGTFEQLREGVAAGAGDLLQAEEGVGSAVGVAPVEVAKALEAFVLLGGRGAGQRDLSALLSVRSVLWRPDLLCSVPDAIKIHGHLSPTGL